MPLDDRAARAAHKLALLTTGTTFRGESVARSTGDRLTAADISAACAGLTDAQWSLISAKYRGETGAQNPLYYAVLDRVCMLAIRENWKLPKGARMLNTIARVAIFESISPSICETCSGRSEVWLRGENKPSTCRACNGIARIPRSDAARAIALGIDASNFSRTWARRYTRALDIIKDEFEFPALREIVGRLE